MKIRNRGITLLIMFVILCNTPMVVYADSSLYVIYMPDNNSNNNQSQTTKLSELLEEYELHSVDVNQVRNKYLLNLSNSDITDEKLEDSFNYVGGIESSILYIKNTKSELLNLKEELLDEYESYDKFDEEHKDRLTEIQKAVKDINNQLTVLEEQLKAGTSTLDTATASYQEALLNASVDKFYRENKQIILDYEVNKLKFGVVKDLLNMMLLKEQKNYYISYENLLNIQLAVEKKKIKLGLATTDNFEKLELEKNSNEILIDTCNNTYQNIYNEISRNTMNKNSSYAMEYSFDPKIYKEEDLILAFSSSNPEIIQLSYFINAYSDYKDSLTNEIHKNQIKYTINNYDIQRTILMNTIRRYVGTTYAYYNKTMLNLSMSKSEISYYSKRYQLEVKKYNLGRSTQLDVKKADLDLRNAYLENYNNLHNKILIEYILDNQIYNVVYN